MIKSAFILLVSVVVSVSAFMASGVYPVSESRQVISLRTIGHKLLLADGDSLSRVLPVKKISDNVFEMHFEKPLALNPDALIRIVGAEQKAGLLPESYIVNVLDYKGNIHYAYNMPVKKDEAPACMGRELPKGRYYISISLDKETNMAWLSAGVLPLFLLFGWKAYNKKKPDAVTKEEAFIKIGSAYYYPTLQKLKVKENYITLTGKESRVLSIFADNINVEVARERLQKEVWEDEGVIVGRSLDMFISKLRKKFQGEPGIQIISIHGKGYKLIVEG